MSNKLKHADVIVHMAKHGFESVEGRCSADDFWQDATSSCNPTRFPDYEWRIKPTTIEYTVKVELPMQVKPEHGKEYWHVDLYDVTPANWDGGLFDNKLFDAGNIWDSRAKAQAAFDAFFKPLRDARCKQ